MNQDHSSKCPFSDATSNEQPPLNGHHRRWDLVQHADLLLPLAAPEQKSLEQSAREAWRNSVRCVGRRLWKALEVVDARALSQADDLFEALLTHLRKATNGGKILPVMSVFREWVPDQPEIRIWNHQLIRYAAYAGVKGETVGDPMNIGLTKLALSLGWKPPSDPTPFDLLPIIIQSGEKLSFYELPEEAVLQVSIRHPKYPCLEEMNLKWYAVPVISDMIFATGSSLYPCAPFSGHYLGTEIGARNLADSNRYDRLPEIASRLGLDTKRRRSLWKDHALIVLNEAVLWSFDQEGVRISDHHNVSDDFLKFCKQEAKEGRDVSAEWSWIVPPISGAATSVFHRSYDLKPVFPNFLLQVPAWKTDRGRALLESTKKIERT
ncbi:MAG: nitric oxide synthase oxygenase [Lentimonas sp.]